jgi:hypothetical protein
MNLVSLAKLSLGALSLSVLTGCYSQSTVFRAVPNVMVNRPGDAGSAGPLVLIAVKPGSNKPATQPDIGSAFDRMSVTQIGIFDPHMGEYLKARNDAAEKLGELKADPQADPDRVKEAEKRAAATQKQVDDYAKEWRDLHRKLAIADNPNSGSVAPSANEQLRKEGLEPNEKQTVLMAAQRKTWWWQYSNSFRQTAVLIIDGPPKPGQYWLTADNSVLIKSSAFSAPARDRVALRGSIKILKVTDDSIIADVALHDVTESDSSELINHLYDQAYYQTPWEIRQKCVFKITRPSDPEFEKAAVHWVAE